MTELIEAVLRDGKGTVVEIREDRLTPYHIITIAESQFFMAHPLNCELEECEYHTVAQGWVKRPAPLGKYRWVGQPKDMKLSRVEAEE